MQANSPTSKLSGKIDGSYIGLSYRFDRFIQISSATTSDENGDVGNLSDLDVLFEAIRTKKGRLDILFANAGGGTLPSAAIRKAVRQRPKESARIRVSLSASLDGYPDGICIDSENMVWYADVPNQRCVRVREGGEVLQTVNLDRGCFACMLGGSDNHTLFLVANEWRGMENIAAVAQEKTGQVLAVEAPAVRAGRP